MSPLLNGGHNPLRASYMHNVHVGHNSTWVKDYTESVKFTSPLSSVDGSIPQLHDDRAFVGSPKLKGTTVRGRQIDNPMV